MKKVFISYRRADSAAMAGRLYDSLSARFGHGKVFFDVDTIGSGDEFKKTIETCFATTGVLLAVMGAQWYQILADRSTKPHEDDYVAIEINSACSRKLPVIPVLVGKHSKEEFDKLLTSELPLARLLAPLQAIEVDEGKDYRHHVDRLIHDVERVLGVSRLRKLRIAGALAIMLALFAIGYGLAYASFKLRYSELPTGAVSIGLRSIEDRNRRQSPPPSTVFRRAKKEIFISGVSCYRTFDQDADDFDEAVAEGKDLYVLIMDPDAPDVTEMSARLNKPVDADIRQVMGLVTKRAHYRTGRIHLRLMSRLPPFTAIMTDGDVAGRNAEPTRSGIIRVQPLVSHNLQHQGIILEFGEGPTGKISGFDFYADDVRKQWADASSSDAKVTASLARP